MQHRHVFTTSLVAVLALAIGFGLSGILLRGQDVAGADLLRTNTRALAQFAGVGKLTYRDSLPPQSGRSAVIDLDKPEVTLYEDGLITDTYSLISVGAQGSPWETPAGRYKVLSKEAIHASPLTRLIFPHAVQIFGNSFLHGDAYKNSPGDSPNNVLGSLRLNTISAEAVYRFLSVGDVVIVKSNRAASFVSVERLASIGAILPDYAAVPKSALKLNSLSYYVADLDTGAVIMSNDEERVRSIASISKLFTTLVATEEYPKESIIEVSPRALTTLGVEGGLVAHERMPLADALYPLLLESSNDMAEAIAESLGRDRFIAQMNEKAKSLGLSHTSFRDPSGLTRYNVSSAKDLFGLARYLYRFRPDVLKIAKTYAHKLESGDGTTRHAWVNHNKFVLAHDERYMGGKTGYIDESGLTSVLLFSLPLAEFSKKNIAIVLLNSVNRDRDNKLILNQLYDSLVYDTGVTLRTVEKIPTEPLFSHEETKDRVSLMFVGNIATKQHGDLRKFFANSGFLKDATIGVANIVGPISDVGYDLGVTPAFRLPASFAKTLRDAGVTVTSLATSHAGDWGRVALEDSVSTLKNAGITPIGAGRDANEAGMLRSMTVNGMSIGFLNIALQAPEWLSTPNNVPVIHALNTVGPPAFLESVRAAAGKVEFLVVVYGSNENGVGMESGAAKSFARSLVDAGAKIVVGVGPHAVGTIEHYKKGVIAYGLGDYIYDEAYLDAPFRGIALEVLLQHGDIIETNGALVQVDEKGIPYLSEDDL